MFSRCIPFFRKKRIENEEVRQPCQPNLQNMPTVVMEEVLKSLDIQSIFRLRNVCRDLQFSINRIAPKLHVKVLFFKLPLTTKSLELYTRDMSETNRIQAINSHRPGTECKLHWKSEDSTNEFEISMEEADALLKNTRLILDALIIDLLFPYGTGKGHVKKKEKDLKKFYGSMKSLLKNRSQLLEIKEIYLVVHNLSEAAELLKCIDPKPLKFISIQCRKNHRYETIEINCSELDEFEQWKNADISKIKGNNILGFIETFNSFKAVNIDPDVIPMEKLDEVKEFFIRSPKLETFSFEYTNFGGMKDQLLSYFGQFDSYNEETGLNKQKIWTWLMDVPDSTDKFQITMKIDHKTCITFSKVQS